MKHLENIVNEESRVVILSEVGWDTHHFNETAYQNLLHYINQEAPTGILVDGAISRVDRPEYLNDQLSYWEKDEEFCREQTRIISNRQQYASMVETQLEVVDQRLQELRQSAPHSQIHFSLDSDDFQFTVSAMVNEAMLHQLSQIDNKIAHYKDKRSNFQSERVDLTRERGRLTKQEGSARQRSGMTRRINSIDRKITNLENELTGLYSEKNLYREKKERPSHQQFTGVFIDDLYARFGEVCAKYDVELITKQSILDIGEMRIDYAHSRHSTWSPIKGRARSFVRGMHGKMQSVIDLGIDVVLESGHHGIGFKQLQKVRDCSQETNFLNQKSYDPQIGHDCVTLVMALPFEDQNAISKYLKGEQSHRMSGGKPVGTRKHHVIDRLKNDSVSGITVLSKDGSGLITTQWIEYDKFVQGDVAVENYFLIAATSDEHVGSPEENNMIQDGMLALYDGISKVSLGGKDAYLAGFISGGDTAEANSRSWNHRYHHQPNPKKILQEMITRLSSLDRSSADEVQELALRVADISRAGSVESMRVILDRVADYYQGFLDVSLRRDLMKWAHVSVTGNHADGVLRDLGMRESDYFVQRLKAKGIGCHEVGVSGCENARVGIGGYSSARIIQVDDYGLNPQGEPLFGPIRLVVQHDPKGGRQLGLVGQGKSTGADLTLAGHTHENVLELYNRGAGQFGVAYRLATLQGVSPTEKYYASSVPRTQAGHLLAMPTPGHFVEKALPASFLQDVGRAALEEKVQEKIDQAS